MSRFTFVPSYSTSGEMEFTTHEVQFGDGYKQRVPSGINTKRLVITAAFTKRTPAELAQIVAFLSAMDGVTAFEWTPPSPYNYEDAPNHSTSGTYALGDQVKSGAEVYACISPHSGSSDLTNTSQWTFLAKVPLKFVCKRGNWSLEGYNADNLSAVFEQVFDP